MKKNVLLILLAYLLPVSVFSYDFLPSGKPVQFLEAGTGLVATRTAEKSYNPFNLTYGISDESLRCDGTASVQFTKNVFDATALIDYYFPFSDWQLTNSRISLGIGLLYHFQRYYDLYSEQDAFADSDFRLKYRNFTFLNKFGIGYKISDVDSVTNGVIRDISLSESFIIDYRFNCGAEIYYETFSHDLYRYPLFISPTYKFGAAWNFSSGFRISADFSIRFRDQFVVTPYADSNSLIFKLRYTF